MTEVVLESQHGPVLVVTMNRPHARNAFDVELARGLCQAFARADRDDDVSVVVLTGTDPAFCAGLDLKALAEDTPGFLDAISRSDCITAAAKVGKPIIGAVNGATFTGGLELALGCDFLIGSERAFFADTHARVGVVPGGGLTVRLPQAVGVRRARQMSFTGRTVEASEALEIGLLNEVVSHAELLPRALEIAGEIAQADPAIMREIKRVYRVGTEVAGGEALRLEDEASRAWQPDAAGMATRRERVMQHNRAQRG